MKVPKWLLYLGIGLNTIVASVNSTLWHRTGDHRFQREFFFNIACIALLALSIYLNRLEDKK